MTVTNIIQKEKKKIDFKLIFFIVFIIATIGGIYYLANRVESEKVWYFLDDTDTGFLGTNKENPTKYQLLDTYDEYIKMYNSIDQWAKKSQKNTSDSQFDIIGELIKQGFMLSDYTEDFFEKNSLLLVENFTYGTVAYEEEVENICVNDNILTVCFYTKSEETIDSGKCILHLITIPKKRLKNVDEIEIDFNNTNISQGN